MKIGSDEHKKQWAEESSKGGQESIWFIEVAIFETQQTLLAKKEELAVIEKRLEEKSYPSAKAGRDELKLCKLQIASLEGNLDRMESDKKTRTEQMVAQTETIKRYLNN